ncbi:DUF485 domain-containing protein [Streptomyces sp. NPDC046759]|uniref:DUF485 domain-containing protein n=1 Tax=Streptomyces sp. NPDC046759 TaxID=3155019 RepID=UPI00340332E2
MTDPFSSPEYPEYPRPPAPPYGAAFPSSPSYVAQLWQQSESTGRGAPRPPAPSAHGELRLLRGAYRRQRRVATFTALGYFTLFLVLSAFAPSLMTGVISGGLTSGLLLGLLQIPVTCLAIALYEHTARRRVDPIADRIREQAAADAGRGATR